jgi:LPXTG-motif cell wall-anchored protein
MSKAYPIETPKNEATLLNFKWIGLGILAAIIGLFAFFRKKK